MPRYLFDYTRVPLGASDPFPNGQVLYRPLLRLHLSVPSNGSRFACMGMVDSGADHCMFPLPFAAALGLDPLRLPLNSTGGVGNVANPTYYADIRLEMPVMNGGPLFVEVYAGFSAGMDAVGMGLLGQSGFFEAFRVTFDHKRRVFELAD